MQKKTWKLLAISAVTAAIGGACYLSWRPATEQAAPFFQGPAAQVANDELTQRRLEGIGSTRDLKPPPILQGNSR